jgi:hypothetical protein
MGETDSKIYPPVWTSSVRVEMTDAECAGARLASSTLATDPRELTVRCVADTRGDASPRVGTVVSRAALGTAGATPSPTTA